MWIPYDIRASLKAESSPETVRLSKADSQRREFLVGFFLRNPVTQVWELDVSAAAEPVEITAGPDLPGARIGFYGNEGGKLGEIIYRLPATSAEDALTRCHADAVRRLLGWQAQIGRGMAIAGWRVADMAHNARWRCTPFRPSAMNIDFAGTGTIDADLLPWAELFQRARNAPDAVSRLMAGFAVIHAALRAVPALSHCGADGFRVTQEMLVHSGALACPEPLEGMDLPQLATVLRIEHDRFIGPDGVLAPVTDDLAGQRRLAPLANLADLIAHRLIINEIRARRTDAASPPTGAQATATPVIHA